MPLDDQERERLRSTFDEFVRTRDPRLRDELVNSHIRLAEHLARRFTNRGVPLDDLVQVASLGLVKAIDRFDPNRGLEFSTFATPTIAGELKRHFRDRGWAIRVPRRIQELHVEINTVVGQLTQRLGQSPTITELARATGTSEEDVIEAIEASRAYQSTSIDATLGPDDSRTVQSMLGAEDERLDLAETRAVLDELIHTLPKREQLMLRLRFWDEMTQSEIADRLGVSQMHVSRLLTKSLAVLRERANVAPEEPT